MGPSGVPQVVGRIHRQGQQSHKVRVVTPVTVADSELIDGIPWSWCKRRSNLIHYKRTIADAVLDGTVPETQNLTPAKVTESILKWLHCLDTDGEITVERKPLTADQPEIIERETAEQAGQRSYGEFSKANARWNRSKSTTTHERLTKDPTEWKKYHSMYRKARQTWPVVPARQFAKMLNQRPSNLTVADLGCGEMLLAESTSDRHTILGFDHIAFDDRVTACDIANVPLGDQTFDISVLSLALMGANCGDYLTEAHRITKVDGYLWLAEPTSRIGENRDRLSDVLGDYAFDLIEMQVIDRFTILRASRSTRDAVEAPRTLLEGTEG